jgi:L-asparaginase II
MTSSHGGEKRHVDLLEEIFAKLDQSMSALDCGQSRPMYTPYYHKMLKEGLATSQANNPCSGKHSAMIGLLQQKKWPLENYIHVDHPVQQCMLDIISDYTQLPRNEIDIAIDGCGVPVFGLPLYNLALAYTRLNDTSDLMTTIRQAMTNNPFYVAGSGRLDTVLMEETKGRILAKLGAESVYCLAIQEEGIAMAMKTEDGGYRALDAFVPDLLLKLSYINKSEHKAIQKRLNLTIRNHRKERVGYMQSLV